MKLKRFKVLFLSTTLNEKLVLRCIENNSILCFTQYLKFLNTSHTVLTVKKQLFQIKLLDKLNIFLNMIYISIEFNFIVFK